MSYSRRTSVPTAAIRPLILAAGLLSAAAGLEPAYAADDKPGGRVVPPPGVLIEPRPAPRERDAGDALPDRERGDDRQGCPTNERPLELLV